MRTKNRIKRRQQPLQLQGGPFDAPSSIICTAEF